MKISEFRKLIREEVRKYAKQFDYAEDSSPQIDFVEGAKWQAERMYSEEEVLEIVSDCDGSIPQAKKMV